MMSSTLEEVPIPVSRGRTRPDQPGHGGQGLPVESEPGLAARARYRGDDPGSGRPDRPPPQEGSTPDDFGDQHRERYGIETEDTALAPPRTEDVVDAEVFERHRGCLRAVIDRPARTRTSCTAAARRRSGSCDAWAAAFASPDANSAISPARMVSAGWPFRAMYGEGALRASTPGWRTTRGWGVVSQRDENSSGLAQR